MKIAAIIAYLLTSAIGAAAEDTNSNAQITVELNTIEPVETGCQATFLTTNEHKEDVEKIVFEAVLFDTEGAVVLLTLFDFGSIPAGRPRVRQFVIPQQDCDALGSILINGVTTCSGADLTASICEAGVVVLSRTDIELLG
ncbi:hypothetical protein [Thalassococcus sp. S3]|uniref:hypothetical protein n=1 Tax=Thalassococcus sp. S3 TaxID=2017482 RepID=UPI00102462F8|nr:hypothetical protein [Thalassococcus sp. S3]QBF30192.1 hypothetical protein CFI11_03030 [Thalassococcus sp. S3]